MSTETKHPLEGIKTTIYLDPEKRTKKEGRALVLKVLGSSKLTETLTGYKCQVHFIGDRRGYNVERVIVMRSVTI